MEMLWTILAVLLIGATPFILWILLGRWRKKTNVGRLGPLAGPRLRDGATTYNLWRGVRTNIELENPNEHSNARYARRHPAKKRKATKPWMK